MRVYIESVRIFRLACTRAKNFIAKIELRARAALHAGNNRVAAEDGRAERERLRT